MWTIASPLRPAEPASVFVELRRGGAVYDSCTRSAHRVESRRCRAYTPSPSNLVCQPRAADDRRSSRRPPLEGCCAHRFSTDSDLSPESASHTALLQAGEARVGACPALRVLSHGGARRRGGVVLPPYDGLDRVDPWSDHFQAEAARSSAWRSGILPSPQRASPARTDPYRRLVAVYPFAAKFAETFVRTGSFRPRWSRAPNRRLSQIFAAASGPTFPTPASPRARSSERGRDARARAAMRSSRCRSLRRSRGQTATKSRAPPATQAALLALARPSDGMGAQPTPTAPGRLDKRSGGEDRGLRAAPTSGTRDAFVELL